MRWFKRFFEEQEEPRPERLQALEERNRLLMQMSSELSEENLALSQLNQQYLKEIWRLQAQVDYGYETR